MSVEMKLKELICERYGSLFEFSKKVGMANSTLNSILSRGVQKASIGNIIKICEELDISADELANNRIVFNTRYNDRKIEVNNRIDAMKLNISSYDLLLDGVKLSSAEIELIFDSVELAVKFIRRTRKEDVK